MTKLVESLQNIPDMQTVELKTNMQWNRYGSVDPMYDTVTGISNKPSTEAELQYSSQFQARFKI
jgi:hypothetical protein